MNNPTTYIRCPACECAVRELDDSPCLNCHRCVFCGRKLKKDERHCDCPPSRDIDLGAKFLLQFIIPDELVARETQRMQIRKQLEMKKAIASGSIGGILVVQGIVFGDIVGQFAWTTYGVYLVCLTITVLLLMSVVDWIFRSIEDRRLHAEYGERSDNEK